MKTLRQNQTESNITLVSRREIKKAQVRETILDVCGRLFRTRGFDETTIADLVAEAGISRQTFFNYFPGKDAVLTELGLRWLREQAEVPRVGSGRPRAGSYLAGTRQAVLAQLRAIERDPAFMRLVFTRSGLLFPQPAAIDPSTARRHHDHTRAIFDGIAMVMQAAQDAGEIRSDIAPLQVAEMYVSQMLMMIRLWLIDYWHDGLDLEERATKALDVLEDGLRADRD